MGGKVGRGHLVIGADVFRRGEIRSADRAYSRASWTEGGAFTDTAGVSIGGNTLFIPTADGTVARHLGDCSGQGYTGILDRPGGYSGTGCGFAYADFAWERARLDRQSLFASLDYPLDKNATLYFDGRFAQGKRHSGLPLLSARSPSFLPAILPALSKLNSARRALPGIGARR